MNNTPIPQKYAFSFIDLFAGIGGMRLGFESVDGKCVFSSEIDVYAQQTYAANFGEVPYGDIRKISAEEIPPFDILLAGFPCQPFSAAGLKRGFEDTRGTLFFDIARIATYHNPKVIFLENVKTLVNHDKGNTLKVILLTLESLGYKISYKILNAKDFGVPQNRSRVYIVAFKDLVEFNFPDPLNIHVKVGDILDKVVDEKHTISDKLWLGSQKRKEVYSQKGSANGYAIFDNESPYTRTLLACYYKDWTKIMIKQEGKNPRKLTPKEAARLQGFPENYVIPVSDTQAYKQFGNSVAVPVVAAIANQILMSINKIGGFKK